MKAKVALSHFCALLIAGAVSGAMEKAPLAELDVFQLEYASDPQISPDGARIVYVRNSMDIMKDRSRSKLWIVDFDGTDHRKLTTGEGDESSPRWSPDGKKLVYVAGTEEGGEIFLRWMDSGQTAKLTQLQRPPQTLVWAPDGKSIAFSMLVPEPPPTLVEPPKKPEGAEWADPPRVTTRLRHEADGVGYLEPGYYHLFVLPVEGGTPRQLTTGSFHHREKPAWTPDGKSLIFSGNRNPGWEHEFVNSEIYSVSLDDGSIRALTDRNGPDASPAVSPDGEQIAYIGFDDKIQTYQVAQLYVMNLNGGEKRVVTPELDRSVSSPTWDAEGKGIYIHI